MLDAVLDDDKKTETPKALEDKAVEAIKSKKRALKYSYERKKLLLETNIKSLDSKLVALNKTLSAFQEQIITLEQRKAGTIHALFHAKEQLMTLDLQHQMECLALDSVDEEPEPDQQVFVPRAGDDPEYDLAVS